MAKLTPMMQQYQHVKDQYPDAFLFYRIGDFYELFNDDAIKGSQLLELTLTHRSKATQNPVPMCGVPHHAVESYIDTLIDKGYKVAICEQMEDPRKAKGMVKRAVTRLVTPGTQMDLTGDAARSNNYLAALVQRKDEFDLAYTDLSTGELKTTTVKGQDAVMNELINLECRELVASDSLSDQMRTVLTKRNVLLSHQAQINKSSEISYLIQDLSDQHQQEVVALLVSYLLTTQKRSLAHMQRAVSYQVSSYMKLDHYSKTNLELTTNMRSGKRRGTLAWLLDETKTAMGSRLLKQWVGRYPIAVLNIQLNPLLVDVNVHPAKREVRLSKEDQLTKLISNLVAQSIDQANLIPDIGDRAIQIHEHQRVDEEPLDIKPGHSAAVKYPTGVTPPVESTQTPTDQQKQFHHTTQTVSGDHDSANPAAADAGDSFVKEPVVIHSKDELRSPQMAEFDRHYQQGEAATPFADESEKIAEPDQSSQKPVKAEQQELAIDDRGDVKEDQFPQLQYIGQLQGTFLLAQASDGLYIVDQHAAQERINFEKFRRELGQVSPDQQQFLTPLVLTYSTSDALKISDHLAVLQGVGLNLEQFGQNSFMLASHPTWFIDGQEEDTAREMIDWVLKDGKLTVGQFRLKAAAMMSCKRAIKANHHLDRQQAQALLVNLSHCENPYNCPHGRPVTIHFTDTDLEKMFKRIQDHHEPYADDFDDHEI